jgi:hypothetical protein
MSPKREEHRRALQQEQESGLLEDVVGENVMFALGSPPGLHCVQARCVWDGHYRVNVFVGSDAVSSRVLHSYFVQADGNGKIVTSCPSLARLY